MDPRRAGRLCVELASRIPSDLRDRISAVVSPAMGGVIVGYEMARALGVEAMFVERPEGAFELRRGFRLGPGQQVLMMEDVVTTGLSRSEEHTSELQSLMRISYAVFCLKKKKTHNAFVRITK